MPAQWEAIALQRRKNREAKIPVEWRLESVDKSRINVISVPRECGILSAKELDITENYDAQSLVHAVSKGRLTAEEVAIAFCKRAAIAQQVTNCLSEIFFDEAIERAKFLDKYLKENGKPLGPFHGLPISLKDPFSIPGYASSVGIVSRSLNLAKTHSTMSSLLLEAGAILYVKTTTPQAQLSFDTDSPLWGRTVNPHNTALTAGGSTGGEGALIAMRGSIMGLGTDMGGSVRIPAACCGIFAIKPTSRRIPRTGTETIEVPGGSYVGLPISCGPLAHSASDCKWFLKVIAETQPWRFDAQVTPYTFASPDRGGKPLKIGIFIDNGISSPLPPVAAMFDEVRHVLAEAGHELELIALPGYSKAFEVALGFIKMSGSDLFFDALEILGNEPLSPWLSRMKRSSVKPHALEEFYKLSHVKENTEASILNGLWERGAKKNRLDVIICPISGHPTPKHDHWTTMDWTAVWALIDYPAGTVPIRNVNPEDLKREITAPSLGKKDDQCRKLWSQNTRKSFVGAPMAIQVVGRKGDDAAVCDAMEAIENAVRHIRTGAARETLALSRL